MSLSLVKCWTVLCDGCGANLLDGAEHVGWVADSSGDPVTAGDVPPLDSTADDWGWVTVRGESERHLCPACQPLPTEDR